MLCVQLKAQGVTSFQNPLANKAERVRTRGNSAVPFVLGIGSQGLSPQPQKPKPTQSNIHSAPAARRQYQCLVRHSDRVRRRAIKREVPGVSTPTKTHAAIQFVERRGLAQPEIVFAYVMARSTRPKPSRKPTLTRRPRKRPGGERQQG